jgi:hypothetical protein
LEAWWCFCFSLFTGQQLQYQKYQEVPTTDEELHMKAASRTVKAAAKKAAKKSGKKTAKKAARKPAAKKSAKKKK